MRFFFGFTCKSQAVGGWPGLNEPFACLRSVFFAVIRLQIHRQRNFNPRYSVKLSHHTGCRILQIILPIHLLQDLLLLSFTEGTHDLRCAYDVTERAHTSNRFSESSRASLCERSNGGRVFDGFRPLISRISKLV